MDCLLFILWSVSIFSEKHTFIYTVHKHLYTCTIKTDRDYDKNMSVFQQKLFTKLHFWQTDLNQELEENSYYTFEIIMKLILSQIIQVWCRVIKLMKFYLNQQRNVFFICTWVKVVIIYIFFSNNTCTAPEWDFIFLK